MFPGETSILNLAIFLILKFDDLNFELAVIEFNALVTNVGSNSSGIELANRFQVMVDIDGDQDTEVGEIVEISSYRNVTLAEPVIDAEKLNSLVTYAEDAGDTHAL